MKKKIGGGAFYAAGSFGGQIFFQMIGNKNSTFFVGCDLAPIRAYSSSCSCPLWEFFLTKQYKLG